MINAAVEAVQEACSPRTWQLGRKLHEDGAVERIADRGAEEQVYRVWAPGRPVAPTATLYVEDEEWDCDCGSRLDCCEHAAAAAHALAAGDSQQAQASAGLPKRKRNDSVLGDSVLGPSASADGPVLGCA